MRLECGSGAHPIECHADYAKKEIHASRRALMASFDSSMSHSYTKGGGLLEVFFKL